MDPVIYFFDGRVKFAYVRGVTFDYVRQTITTDDPCVSFSHKWIVDYVVIRKDSVSFYENTELALTINLSEEMSENLAALFTHAGITFH